MWVYFVCYGNWQVMPLFLSWPLIFSVLSSQMVLLKSASQWVAGRGLAHSQAWLSHFHKDTKPALFVLPAAVQQWLTDGPSPMHTEGHGLSGSDRWGCHPFPSRAIPEPKLEQSRQQPLATAQGLNQRPDQAIGGSSICIAGSEHSWGISQLRAETILTGLQSILSHRHSLILHNSCIFLLISSISIIPFLRGPSTNYASYKRFGLQWHQTTQWYNGTLSCNSYSFSSNF